MASFSDAAALSKDLSLLDVQAEIARLLQRDNDLNSQLEGLLVDRGEILEDSKVKQGVNDLEKLEQEIDVFAKDAPVNSIREEMSRIARITQRTASSAMALSSKVRQLDSAQQNVCVAVDRVSSVLDLRVTINTVSMQLRAGQHKEAATNIFRVLHLQNPVKNNSSYSVLVGLERDLVALLLEQEATFLAAEDWPKLLELYTIFPLVNKPAEGAQKYSNVARKAFRAELLSENLLVEKLPENAVVQYPEHLTSILDIAANCVPHHARQLQRMCCAGAHLVLLHEIQEEVDTQVVALLRRFCVSLNLRRMSTQATVLLDSKASQGLAAVHSVSAGLLGTSKADARSNSAHGDANLDGAQVYDSLEDLSYVIRECESFEFNLSRLAAKAKTSLEKLVVPVTAPTMIGDVKTAANSGLESKTGGGGGGGKTSKVDFEQAVKTQVATSVLQNLSSKLSKANYTRQQTVTTASLAQAAQQLPSWRRSRVSEQIQEMATHYIKLDEYYMTLNVRKAVAMDNHNPLEEGKKSTLAAHQAIESDKRQPLQLAINRCEAVARNLKLTPVFDFKLLLRFSKALDAVSIHTAQSGHIGLTSTLVDDLFYVLKKCGERSFGTFNSSSVCASINLFNRVLGQDLATLYAQIIAGYASKYGTSGGDFEGGLSAIFSAAKSAADIARQNRLTDDELLFVTINNAQISSEYVRTLRTQLELEYKENFGEDEHAASNMVKACMNELASCSRGLLTTCKRGISQLTKMLIQVLTPFMEAYQSAQYTLSEEEYVKISQNRAFPGLEEMYVESVQVLLQAVETVLFTPRRCMTHRTFTMLVTHLVTHFIVPALERKIYEKKFSFWGGLLLDKHIREVMTYFSEVNQSSMRENFTKLTQTATILQLERVSEIQNYWQPGQPQSSLLSKFTKQQVTRVLSLRADFQKKDILSAFATN